MKRQLTLVLTVISLLFFSSAIEAQTVSKKKATVSAPKKTTMAAKKSLSNTNKKITSSSKLPNTNTTPVLNNTKSSNTCKVIKSIEGATIVFNFKVDPTSELSKSGDVIAKKEFKVSYLNNSVTEVGRKEADGSENKIKTASPLLNDEVARMESITVSIKDLLFVFDNLKDKKKLPFANDECALPANLQDGIYEIFVNWNWNMPSDIAPNSYCTSKFKLEVKNGYLASINN